jgi:hypothetical protein
MSNVLKNTFKSRSKTSHKFSKHFISDQINKPKVFEIEKSSIIRHDKDKKVFRIMFTKK